MSDPKDTDLAVRDKKALETEEGLREGPWFEPDVDIYEDDGALTLVADMPGATDEDISIDLRDRILTITAHVGGVEEQWRPVYREYRVGHYTRRFRVGHAIDQSGITARLVDGVLTLHLPKVQEAQPRRIEVNTG